MNTTTFTVAKLDNGKYRAERGDGFRLGEFDTQRAAVGACSACADIDGDTEITIKIVRR